MLDGVPVVAMHRNMTWNTTDGLRIDTGMYLTGMEQACGKTATAIGKPAAEGFLAAADRVGVDPQQMVMIGDDLHNDVLAAQAVGMTAPESCFPEFPKPDVALLLSGLASRLPKPDCRKPVLPKPDMNPLNRPVPLFPKPDVTLTELL